MILQHTNFNVPARFSFQPYSATWRLASAETLEWVEEPKLMQVPSKLPDEPEKNRLRVRIGASLYGALDLLYGIDSYPSYTVLMDRASIPPDVLQAHESYRNTPDISGRSFQVLICQKPEFKDGPWALKPGEITKSAWIMRDEFLNLEADPELGWDWAVRQFLNKWGIWESGRGFSEDWSLRPLTLIAPSALVQQPKIERPDFVLVPPQLLKEQQAKYRRALLPSNARSWLRSHPMSLESADEFPFFRVRSSYCSSAIETTITIDHLAEIKFGICKRCHKVFEKEKKYKMSYCSRSCANAASVARFREKQRKPEWTAAKIAKLLSQQKGAKRNAKG
jgi:hypothetical protein